MNFFVILIAYYLYLNAEKWHHLQRISLFDRWWTRTQKLDGTLGIILFIVVPMVLVQWALNLMADAGGVGRLVEFVFTLFIIIQLLGDRNLDDHFSQFQILLKEQGVGAAVATAKAQLAGQQLSDPVRPEQWIWRALTRRSLIDFFAILIWYALLGLEGALLWRLLFHVGQERHCWVKFRLILSWLPVRFMLLVYALVGYFAKAWPLWIQSLSDTTTHGSELLADSAEAAVNPALVCTDNLCVDDNLTLLRNLIRHSEMACLGLFSVLTLIGL